MNTSTKTSKTRKTAAKRADADILADLRWVECALSPENLYRDGMASRSEAARRAKTLYRQRDKLVAELGREPSIQEIYGIAC